jgi:hypothetical protein
MALAQNKPIAQRPIWFLGAYIQDAGIQNGEQIGHGKGSPDMGCFRIRHHAKRFNPC